MIKRRGLHAIGFDSQALVRSRGCDDIRVAFITENFAQREIKLSTCGLYKI